MTYSQCSDGFVPENNSTAGDSLRQRWLGGEDRTMSSVNGHGASYGDFHQESLEHDQAESQHEDSLHSAKGPSQLDDAPSSVHFAQTLSEMRDKIATLERKLAYSPGGMSHHITRGQNSVSSIMDSVQAPPEAVFRDNDESIQFVAEVKERTWFEFMNKATDEPMEFAIEVLTEEPDYIRSADAPVEPNKRRSKIRPPAAVTSTLNEFPKQTLPAEISSSKSVPDRIRINSTWILRTLALVDDGIEASGPIVMLRPYKMLIFREHKIIEIIRDLKDKCKSFEAMGETTATSAHPSVPASEGLRMAHLLSMLCPDSDSCRQAIEHLNCVNDFLSKYVKPTMERLRNGHDGRVSFRDLWYLYPPGENIYMPLKVLRRSLDEVALESTPETFHGRYELRWRVTSTGGGYTNASTHRGSVSSLRLAPFSINCYYIDFDGKYFVPIIHTFSIMPYKGERDIIQLDFFPQRYMRSLPDKTLESLNRGKWIFDNIAHRFTHYYYSGPTLVVHPCGCPLQGGDSLNQEHVESEVIVDFRTTLLKNPGWRPKQTALFKMPVRDQCKLQEKQPVRYWTSNKMSKLQNSTYDPIQDEYDIDVEMSNDFRIKEQIFAPVANGWLSNESQVPERDIPLLTGRVFGFVLRTRTFAPLWVWHLQPIKPQSRGLNDLQLRDQSIKDTIQALVRTHFSQNSAAGGSDIGYDLIRGKGKGLVILLHGAPGVGKTSTAESVAAANGKPLFSITCGDLGLTPKEVEKALKEIFRFAQLWQCVLLLDECDIFLAQRAKDDIKRNSLVAVFLRTLEFYNGVLFLTTNRVGVLDDALKSRITWAAYYPPLDEEQTRLIWKVNLRSLEEQQTNLELDKKSILRFAREHFRSNADQGTGWNGRQIQNAVKVAVALAEWDAYSGDERYSTDIRVLGAAPKLQPRLSRAQFDTIATAARAFDRYLQEATGFNEAERAFNNMERADDYALEEDISTSHQFLSPTESGNARRVSVSSTKTHEASYSSTLAAAHLYGSSPGTQSFVQPSARRVSKQQQQQISPTFGVNQLSPPIASTQGRKSPNQFKDNPTSPTYHQPHPSQTWRNRSSSSAVDYSQLVPSTRIAPQVWTDQAHIQQNTSHIPNPETGSGMSSDDDELEAENSISDGEWQ